MIPLITLLCAALCGFAAEVEIPVLPADAWRVECGPDDRVALTASEGCLEVRAEVAVDGTRQHGNWTFNQKDVLLWLRRPVPVPAGMAQVVFDAWGHEAKTWNTRDVCVQLWPMLRDRGGELLSYIPRPYPHLMAGRSGWGRWMTPEFQAGEAGGATQDIFTASGGDGNSWPDAPLELAGLRLVVRRASPGRREARILLGRLALAGGAAEAEAPFCFADAVVKEAGRYRFAGEVSTSFQATPVLAFGTEFAFDPQRPATGSRRLEMPLPRGAQHWIGYRVAAGDGRLVAGDRLRWHMGSANGPAGSSLARTAPPAGCLRLNPDRDGGGAYAEGEPLAVAARVFRAGGALSLRWRLMPYAFDEVLEQGSIDLPAGERPFHDAVIALAGRPGRDAYRLLVAVHDGGTEIDAAEYVLGRAHAAVAAMPGPGLRGSPREDAKRSAYVRATYMVPSTVKLKSEDEAVARFAANLDQAGALARCWTVMVDVAALEVLPGVWDFALLDRYMAAAAERGLRLTVRFGHIDKEHAFRWLPFSRQHSQDGHEIDEHFYGGFSLGDRAYLEHWHRAFRAVHDRYRDCPAFEGYYLLQPAGEFTFEDKPWEGLVAGYEPALREAFIEWLRRDRGLDLAALAARWGRPLASWDEVRQPRPDFALGKMPDLRREWTDFCAFKAAIDESGWFPEVVRRIRAYDPRRVVIAYGLTGDGAAGIDFYHNGGNHFLQAEGALVGNWTARRIGWITEPHHPHRWAAYGDPGERGWVLDWSVWVMLAQAGAGGANLHVYYHAPDSGDIVDRFGGAFALDRFQRYRPILDELHRASLVAGPARIGLVQDPQTLWCKHRTIFAPRLQDLRRGFELFRHAGLAAEDARADRDYPLLVLNPLDEVLSGERIADLERRVRAGARLVMTAVAGRWSVDEPGAAFPLLRRLGIAPPAQAFDIHSPGVEAAATGRSPLLQEGERLPFFSLADLRRDLQSAEIKQRFWAFPYRWIPETDYFGRYPGHPAADGRVLARFADGGAALSCHALGAGEVAVLWGVPDYRPERLAWFAQRLASWAGVGPQAAASPVQFHLELTHAASGRHYLALYHEASGDIREPVRSLPATRPAESDWLAEELVGDRKLGVYSAAQLRDGVPLTWLPGASPLQIIRLTPVERLPGGKPAWLDKYRSPGKP